ncbi:MAG: hypothetical protein A4E57_03936 [Syntrophorhabdaceae bacterium PtaU1.Bin034]|nr:MAG: hypothetical protein A4E57_03936 [Syntrophorhabdaceae bacterium PtaU1.Bin034]
MGIEVLICGGIDGINKAFFEERGILVIDNAMGDAMDILGRFLSETREGNEDVTGKCRGPGYRSRNEGNKI